MSAKAVRACGIVAIATVLIVPASGILSAILFGLFPSRGSHLLPLVLVPVLMYYAFVACAAFAFWATKQVFNASGYRSADLAIGTLFAALAFVPPAAPLMWAWFAILATRFGSQTGSTLWQAIGIIYLLASVSTAVAVTIFVGVAVPYVDELGALAGLLLLVGWLCHGIRLILDARKMAGTDPGASR